MGAKLWHNIHLKSYLKLSSCKLRNTAMWIRIKICGVGKNTYDDFIPGADVTGR